ncbi:MAG: hypothetical protein WAK17_00835 [Candidatus Nitrosopolaris sp.]|jgi:hypothetical protein
MKAETYQTHPKHVLQENGLFDGKETAIISSVVVGISKVHT